MRRARKLLRAASFALLAAAFVAELRKPSGERTWHGRLGGFVPYDFRRPTLARLKAAWWSPEEPRIFTDRPFGVGWAVNLGRLVRLVRGRTG
jgi:hypothetical protein